MRQEENNRNWNKVLSMPVSKNLVFIAKLIQVVFMIFLSEIWICTLFVISGKVIGLTSAIPCDKLITWCLFGTLGGSGMVFLAKHLGHIWPYSLMAYGMNSNAPQELIKSGYMSFVIICIVYIAIFMITSSTILSKRDI